MCSLVPSFFAKKTGKPGNEARKWVQTLQLYFLIFGPTILHCLQIVKAPEDSEEEDRVPKVELNTQKADTKTTKADTKTQRADKKANANKGR